MDRKSSRLIFWGAISLVSLLWYAFGGDKDTVADQDVQKKMLAAVHQSNDDESEAVKMAAEAK